jgi:transposase
MARDLYWLSDAEWAAIQPHLPTGRRGARRVDDRRVISGILHMLKTGARWRDCPAEYGPYTTIYNRFNRWSKQGVWEDVFYVLSGSSGVIGTTSADSTSVKAQRSASGGKGGSSRRPSGDRAADGRPRFTP